MWLGTQAKYRTVCILCSLIGKREKKKHLYLYREILEEDTRPKRPVIDRAGVGMDTWGTKRGRLLHCTFFVKYIFILNCVNVLPTQK